MEGSSHGPRFELAKLILAVVSTLVVVAGLVVGLAAGNKISISLPKETVPVSPPPSTGPVRGSCNQEPNEERIEAIPIALGTCQAAIETVNDQDWYLFQSAEGGPVEIVVEKARTREPGDVISATLYEDEQQIASELVAADESFSFPYTLARGSELTIVVEDGCAPACGPTGYSFELN